MEKPTPPTQDTHAIELGPSNAKPPPTYEQAPFTPVHGPPTDAPNVPKDIHGEPPHGGAVPPGGPGTIPQNNLACAPIQSLQSQSAPVLCPSCGMRNMTVVTAEAGGFLHGIAALVCLVSCLGCIPYCISSLKDVHHKCGNCGIALATFHRSGRTEVHAYSK
ncbi:hypothetical protein AK830_g11417 [Neonectria ditissima]|uniref:LITAF domain-containing protein n=1 Tax=Neonectria ditissima TaxID=78410 RepID=A0A0P7ACX1_9HYPO|nr:hypothetical protein AK830_g11417 [Neonectria ditissima]